MYFICFIFLNKRKMRVLQRIIFLKRYFVNRGDRAQTSLPIGWRSAAGEEGERVQIVIFVNLF